MSWPVKDIPPLGEREIAGAGAYNRLLWFVLNFRPISPFLTLNPDGKGSYTIDLDFAALAADALEVIAPAILRGFDFAVTVSNGTLYVNGGRIFLPDRTVIATAITQAITDADNGKMVYVRMTSANAAEIVFDSPVTHTMQTGGGNYRVTLPLALLSYADGAFSVRYLHLGAFHITQEPYFYINGYNRGASQFLAHDAGADGLRWIANCCDQSSSSASGSSSSSGSASSSSSSGGGGGLLRIVTASGEQPTGAEGDYYPNGDPHSTATTWTAQNGNYMAWETYGWDEWRWFVHYTSTETGDPTHTECSRGADYDPTDWTQQNPATGDLVWFEAYYVADEIQ